MDDQQLTKWTDDPIDRLRRMVEWHADEPASLFVHQCNGPDGSPVGLTWEDLRLILAEMEEPDEG